MNYSLGKLKKRDDSRDLLFANYLREEFKIPKKKLYTRTSLPVLDQKDQPACVGFSAALKKIEQERREHRTTYLFDGLDLYSYVAQPGGGAYLRDIAKHLKNIGAEYKERFYKIDAFASVVPINFDSVRRAICLFGPCIIGIEVYTNFFEPNRQVLDTVSGNYEGGHAIVLLGYSEDVFVLQNSWGQDWNENGLVKVKWNCFSQICDEIWTTVDTKDEKIKKMFNTETFEIDLGKIL